MGTLNTSVSGNNLATTTLSKTVTDGFTARYIKMDTDALLATINTKINLKVSAVTYVAGLLLKQDKIIGLLASVLSSTVTTNSILISSNTGTLSVSNVLSEELAFISGVKFNIQIQLDALVSRIIASSLLTKILGGTGGV